MRPKKPEGDKRKRYNILLSPNERKILSKKMDKYGYSDLSSYLRDAGIYERIYVEEISGKLKITNDIAELINVVKSYQIELKDMLLLKTWTKYDKDLLLKRCDSLDNSLKELENTVEEVLWISTKRVALDPKKFVKQVTLFDEEEREEE